MRNRKVSQCFQASMLSSESELVDIENSQQAKTTFPLEVSAPLNTCNHFRRLNWDGKCSPTRWEQIMQWSLINSHSSPLPTSTQADSSTCLAYQTVPWCCCCYIVLYVSNIPTSVFYCCMLSRCRLQTWPHPFSAFAYFFFCERLPSLHIFQCYRHVSVYQISEKNNVILQFKSSNSVNHEQHSTVLRTKS